MRIGASVTIGIALLLGGSLWTSKVMAGRQANMAHVHMGHVLDKFPGTPDQQGLLTAALAEAKVAAQHAAFAAKSPDNLDAMKLHAGHVIHAIDPTVEMKGPGIGYGAKKASEGVAQHIDMAGKFNGASANVKTHSAHVSAAATSTATRAAEALAVAQKVRAASSASDAATLIAELQKLTEQLTAGADANGDGRVGWDAPEGGLQQAEQHMQLMKKGEGL